MSWVSNIEAITFDAGGTLISPWPSVGEIYAQVAREFGVSHADGSALTNAFGLAWKERANFGYSLADWETLVLKTFQQAHGHHVSSGMFQALYDKFSDPECWKVQPRLAKLLPELKRRYKLGVISNWDERLRPLLQKLGLASYFDSIVISCDVGATKPSPAIFATAQQQLGVPAAKILHVGDSKIEDVHGARAAGFQAFHFLSEEFTNLPLS